MLNVIMLSVIMLSVIMLSVIMLNVVAPVTEALYDAPLKKRARLFAYFQNFRWAQYLQGKVRACSKCAMDRHSSFMLEQVLLTLPGSTQVISFLIGTTR